MTLAELPARWLADLPAPRPDAPRFPPSVLPPYCDGNGHLYGVTLDGARLLVTVDDRPVAVVWPPDGFRVQCATAWRSGAATVVRLSATDGTHYIDAGVTLPDSGAFGEMTQGVHRE